jgi:hypothetical protein
MTRAVRVRRTMTIEAREAAEDGADAEPDQHGRDGELETGGGARRERGAGDEEHGTDDEQGRRVPEPPQGAEERAPADAAGFADQRRDGGEVIGLERVAQAEEDPEGDRASAGEHRGRR